MKFNSKWYNDPEMVGGLFMFFPPLGIYGLYKSETIDPAWKKAVYGIMILAAVLLAITYLA